MPSVSHVSETAPRRIGWRGLAPKLFAVVAMLAALSGGLAIGAMGLLDKAETRLERAEGFAHRGILSGRIITNLVNFVRGVEYLPLELTAEQRQRWETQADREFAQLNERLTELEQTAQLQSSRDALVKVRAALEAYRPTHVQVKALSREGKFEEATALVIRAVPIVDEAARLLTGIEERVRDVLRETVENAHEEAIAARRTIMVLAGTGTLLAIGLALWIILRGVTGPLTRLAGTANALAAGRLEEPTPETARRDEVGAIARGLETLRGAALRARELEAEARAAEEKAALAAREARLALAGRVETQLGSVMTTLAEATERLEASIGTVSDTAEQATLRAASVASSANQASANVQTVSSAAEELAASVGEITRQVAQAAQVARQAVTEAEAADATVVSLNDAAKRIGVVVQLIGDIAGQTNLLALNATIEAARAGDAGKGFAVVASEVKQLAGQTAKATEEIGQQITAIQEATARAVQSIRGIAGVVGQVDQIATSIASAVEEQGAATREIARNVSEAATGTDDVSMNITHVSTGMAATRDALGEMRATTAEVTRQNATLQGEMETLTRGLRAA